MKGTIEFLKRLMMSRKWLVLPPIFVGVIALGAFVSSQNEIPRTEPVEQPRPVRVVRVKPTEISPVISGFGTANTARQWQAVAEVQGRIVEIHPSLESGNSVNAEDLLVRIDAKDLQLLLNQRQADLESAKARLQELEDGFASEEKSLKLALKRLELAIRDEQRSEQLTHSKAVSLGELDQSRSARIAQEETVQNIRGTLSVYPSQIKGAKAAISLAEAKVNEVERDIERTTIYSPFSGVLSNVNLEVGQFVGMHEQLFSLQDDRTIEVTANFSMAQIEELIDSDHSQLVSNQGSFPFSAQVFARSGKKKRSWDGTPVRILDSMNEQSRTLGVVFQVLNPSHQNRLSPSVNTVGSVSGKNEGVDFARQFGALRPGTFCEVVLQGPASHDRIVVPRTALNVDKVYVVDSENRLRSRKVETGFSVDDSLTIVSGLSEGDVVVAVAPVPAVTGELIDPQFDLDTTTQNVIDSVAGSSSEDTEEPLR